MHSDNYEVLAVGSLLLEESLSNLNIRYLCVDTLSDAAEQLRRVLFEVVVLQVDFSNSANVHWIRYLRMAKPYLPILALSGNEPLAESEEALLRQAGVTAIMKLDQWDLQLWFAARSRQVRA